MKPSVSLICKNLAALDAFDQHLDVAVGQLQALHDVDDRADLVDLVGLGLVDAGVMLGGQKDLLVGGQRFFQGANARFAAHHERRHHVGEDDHVPDGHHGKFFGLEFFLGLSSLYSPELPEVAFASFALALARAP